MAGLTKEQRTAKAADGAVTGANSGGGEIESAQVPTKAVKAKDDHLVAMTKDGETLKIHPSCVADHQRLGWEL